MLSFVCLFYSSTSSELSHNKPTIWPFVGILPCDIE